MFVLRSFHPKIPKQNKIVESYNRELLCYCKRISLSLFFIFIFLRIVSETGEVNRWDKQHTRADVVIANKNIKHMHRNDSTFASITVFVKEFALYYTTTRTQQLATKKKTLPHAIISWLSNKVDMPLKNLCSKKMSNVLRLTVGN